MTEKVAVIMGSTSDWETMKFTCDILDEFGIAYQKKLSLLIEHQIICLNLQKVLEQVGFKSLLQELVVPLTCQEWSPQTTLPVIGVPIESAALKGMDSLLSIVQMPGGVPVATVAIGKAGATNAGLLALEMLSMTDGEIADKLDKRRIKLKEKVMESSDELV